jgi:hypothetical protein
MTPACDCNCAHNVLQYCHQIANDQALNHRNIKLEQEIQGSLKLSQRFRKLACSAAASIHFFSLQKGLVQTEIS